jgi:Flp pilus assembly pilin Flp
MLNMFRSLTRKTRNASLVDCSLIAAIVAVAGISALKAMGGKGFDFVSAVATSL